MAPCIKFQYETLAVQRFCFITDVLNFWFSLILQWCGVKILPYKFWSPPRAEYLILQEWGVNYWAADNLCRERAWVQELLHQQQGMTRLVSFIDFKLAGSSNSFISSSSCLAHLHWPWSRALDPLESLIILSIMAWTIIDAPPAASIASLGRAWNWRPFAQPLKKFDE